MNAYYIKWLAVIFMTIDHIGYFLLPEYKILRIIGRLSFPLFAFLIANGYRYTRDPKKYLFRLLSFGIVIQLVAFYTAIPINIFFTLSLGLVSIMIYERPYNQVTKYAGVLFMCYIAYTIKSDYGAYGVLLIFVIYLLKTDYMKMIVAITILSLAFYGFSSIQVFAAFTPLIMMYYNEEPGRKMKYFFYLFYPVHILVLSWISTII